jgi:fructoselysine-6-P-deglycase FrlB-like protein
MHTIDALENDIKSQLKYLNEFKAQKPLSIPQQNKTVVCGSGDSLAAAMLAESFSDYRIRAQDPLYMIKNKKLGQKKRVYFVSISGNTISNIRAAKNLKHAIAITKNQSSKLAKICKKTIALYYVDSGILTSGSIGFLSSALTCVSLICSVRTKNAKKLFLQAQKQTKPLLVKNTIYVIGNQYTYPISMYAAAKLYEVLGINAHYERIEQFSHMGLFSAKFGDTVIIFEEKNKHNLQLAKNLKKLGLVVFHPSIKSKNKIDQMLFYIFVSQLLALHNAKRKHLKDCYFVTQKKIRAASSDMIY